MTGVDSQARNMSHEPVQGQAVTSVDSQARSMSREPVQARQ